MGTGKLNCPDWSSLSTLLSTFVDFTFCSLSVRVEINCCLILLKTRTFLLNAIAAFLSCFIFFSFYLLMQPLLQLHPVDAGRVFFGINTV